jgi:6-phosphofructokinase 1
MRDCPGPNAIFIPELTPALTPEIIDGCCHHLAELRAQGRKFALIVISEGC